MIAIYTFIFTWLISIKWSEKKMTAYLDEEAEFYRVGIILASWIPVFNSIVLLSIYAEQIRDYFLYRWVMRMLKKRLRKEVYDEFIKELKDGEKTKK